jgi:hypothetical protein
MYDIEDAPTESQVAKFKYLSPMLDSALSEMREFAKKKQDGIVSATKIKILNRLLGDIRGILEREESAGYLDLLSEDQLPQNSDAVIVLGQYRAALNSFQEKHSHEINFRETWITKEWLEENPEYTESEDDEEEADEYEDESEESEDEEKTVKKRRR